ncbi:MAG: hypothetical protein ACRD0K_15545 [Egibacteraceae bacterium]
MRCWSAGSALGAGVLLGPTGTGDPIDATLVLVIRPDDRILTSDPDDLRRLVAAAGRSVAVVSC